ncbi:MAG: VCBS repeat-containing protein, partial [Pyrinomonadaceae bacterium]|nr:VCBS repeat-containing protein [Pyrinomonadaceae bacterium]
MKRSSIRSSRLIAITLITLLVLMMSRTTWTVSPAPAQATSSCDTPSLSIATYRPNTYSYPNDIETGDFNGDQKPDLVSYDKLLMNAGDGKFGPPLHLSNSLQLVIEWKALGDFNGDGKLDVSLAGGLVGAIRLQTLFGDGNGAFTFNAGSYAYINTKPFAVSVGDFNHDGKSDLALVVYGTPLYKVRIWLSNGDGSFTPGLDYPVGMEAADITATDFNHDGKLDLAVLNRDSEDVSIFLGVGNGTFSAATNFLAGPDAWVLASGDFNGDGQIDLAIASYYIYERVAVLLGTGTGGFSAPIYNSNLGLTYSITAGDFNGDGKSDIAVTSYQAPEVLVFIATGGG